MQSLSRNFTQISYWFVPWDAPLVGSTNINVCQSLICWIATCTGSMLVIFSLAKDKNCLMWSAKCHHIDVIIRAMASQITGTSIVCLTVVQAQIKENVKALRHWPLCGWPVNSLHKGPVTRKCFHLMTSSCLIETRCLFQYRDFYQHRMPIIKIRAQGGRFKNTYELLNLRALKISLVNKIHIFQCMGKIFCVEFQRYPLKFHTKYLTHTLKDTIFIQHWNFKSS